MTAKTVKLQITFEAILEAIASLELEDKRRLQQLLETEIARADSAQILQSKQDESNLITQTPPVEAGENICYETSGEILTLAEMTNQYPDRWLLIGQPEVDENHNIIRGQVLAYSPDQYEIYNALSLFDVKSIAIEYTGAIAEDLAVLMSATQLFWRGFPLSHGGLGDKTKNLSIVPLWKITDAPSCRTRERGSWGRGS